MVEAVKVEGVVEGVDQAEWEAVELPAQMGTACAQIVGTRFHTTLVNPATP